MFVCIVVVWGVSIAEGVPIVVGKFRCGRNGAGIGRGANAAQAQIVRLMWAHAGVWDDSGQWSCRGGAPGVPWNV